MLSEKKGSGCQLTQDSESVLVAQSCQTVEHHGILSMGFSRQEYKSGLPCPSPGNLPNPGTEPRSPTLWADSLPSEPPGKPQDSELDTKNGNITKKYFKGKGLASLKRKLIRWSAKLTLS